MKIKRKDRKSNRLEYYDYSSGEIIDSKVVLSAAGNIAQKSWLEMKDKFENIELDEFIFMPNHFHAIVHITSRRGLINQTPTRAEKWILMKEPKLVLGKIIRYYKARTSKLIHDYGIKSFKWQRNYYDHVIREESDLNKIREYIINNPINWDTDRNNPININTGIK